MASHRAAQGVVYADMIREETGDEVVVNFGGHVCYDFNEFDKVYVYHGNDWSGGLNLYGGTKGFPYAWNFRNLTKFKGEVISLGIPFPDYHRQLQEKLAQDRGNGHTPQPEFDDIDWDNLKRMEDAPVLRYPHITPSIVVGDSHSICMYRPGWTVNSVPFKTLRGALKQGLETFVWTHIAILLKWRTSNSISETSTLGTTSAEQRLKREPTSGHPEDLAYDYLSSCVELFETFPNLSLSESMNSFHAKKRLVSFLNLVCL
jgi:hypothetical protein